MKIDLPIVKYHFLLYAYILRLLNNYLLINFLFTIASGRGQNNASFKHHINFQTSL